MRPRKFKITGTKTANGTYLYLYSKGWFGWKHEETEYVPRADKLEDGVSSLRIAARLITHEKQNKLVDSFEIGA